MTDDEIAAGCIQGSPAAWRALVDRHGPGMMAAVRHVLRTASSETDAEDALANAFLALVDNDAAVLGRYRPGTNLKAFLRRIAVTQALLLLRRRGTRPSSADLERARKYCELVAGPRAPQDPARRAANRELARAAAEALAELAPRDQLVLKLRHLDGASNDEIGRAIGIAASGVSNIISRAEERLRKKLADKNLLT